MKRAQKETLRFALDLRTDDNKSPGKKLLFRKSQFDLLQRIGLLDSAINIEDSVRFQVR